MEIPSEKASGKTSGSVSINSREVSRFVEGVITNALRSVQSTRVLSQQDATVPPMNAALPATMVTGLDTGKSSDLIQESISEASAASAGDNEAATEIDGVKADMSPVDDAAITTMTTVVDPNSANLVEEPTTDAASNVDTVTQEPSATKADEAPTSDVAVAELSNADASLVEEPRTDAASNVDSVTQELSATTADEAAKTDVALAELSNADANTIAVAPAKGDVPSKEDEAVIETVAADNQDSAKTGEILVDNQGSTIAEAKEQHPTYNVESAVSKDNTPDRSASVEAEDNGPGSPVKAKRSLKFFNRNKVAPSNEGSAKKPASEEEIIMVALENTFYSMDKDKIVTYTGVRDENDNVVLVINPQNIPVKTKEEQKTTWAQIGKSLQRNMPKEKFVIIIKPTMPIKETKNLYQLMKESFSDKLSSCLIHRPGAKFKAAYFVCRPFLQKKMRKKIFITNSVANVSQGHGIPAMITRFLK